MASVPLKRLLQEYRQLTNNPPEGILAAPISDDDIFTWKAAVMGPKDTPYDGGLFLAELKFPRDYPLNPPKMRFTSSMWHPNSMLSCTAQDSNAEFLDLNSWLCKLREAYFC